MPSMSAFNHRMLILAREARGMTQTDLSKKTGTDQGYLSKIERGWTTSLSEEMIQKYAEALDFPVTFFYQQENKTPISDFFYRKRLTMPAKEKIALEAQIDILRLVYDKLLKSVEIPEPKFPAASVHKNFKPSDVARMTREFFRIPKGPIADIVSLLERNGVIIVFMEGVSDKFDGMTVFTESNHPMIVLNKDMTNDRKRFTICHELAHQIMHLPHRYDFELYEKVQSNPDTLEKEADEFAAEFLMPENDCRNDLTHLTYSSLSQLKMYWKASKRAIVYRAKTLKCIDEKRFKNLMIELSRMGERVKERFDIEIDQPIISKQLFRAHFQQLGFTQKTLSNHLSVNETDLLQIVRVNSNNNLKIAI